ncbi:MAG: nucleotidyltransferase family protein [Rhodospirillales bacterium]
MFRLSNLRCVKQAFTALRLVGSVARGDAKPGSDVDVLVDLDPEADLGLMEVIGLKHIIEDHIGFETDVLRDGFLHPLARDNIMADAVTVF